jgi:putative membrane protein
MAPERSISVVRDHLANERTFLAWLRGGMGAMAVGVIVAKLGVILGYLRSHGLGYLQSHGAPQHIAYAGQVGAALVLVGVAIIVGATASYLRNMRRIERRELRASVRADLALARGLVVFAMGLAVYLLLST